MDLSNNPFHILKLTCTANRKSIMTTSEEMSFILDVDICTDAQNNLINPAKRLASELGWFLDIDENLMAVISNSIDNEQAIDADSLNGLSKHNATVYNFTLSAQKDCYETEYKILDIDEQFSALDASQITKLVNSCRDKAKFPEINSQAIALELNKKREYIRQVITERLTQLDENSYIELVTMLAEKYNYNDGPILSDVIDQYAICMQTKIEEYSFQIKADIDRVKQSRDDNVLSENIQKITSYVRQWDKLVQPIQLKSKASGIPHEISEEIGLDLRNLSLYLHNEKGKATEALLLVNAMKGVFAELRNLSELFEEDSETLEGLILRDKEVSSVLGKIEELKKLSERITVFTSGSNVENFIFQIIKLDSRIKTLDLDESIRNNLRASICYIARDTAIELHNKEQQTSYALTIAKALLNQFSELPSLKVNLSEDVANLDKQLGYQRNLQTLDAMQESKQKSKNIGSLVMVGIFVSILIISAILNSGRSNSSSNALPFSSSSSYTSGKGTSSEVSFSSSSTSGEKVYADIVSIWPAIGLHSKGANYFSNFACECVTSLGSTVWVYMTATDYKENIDSSLQTSTYNSKVKRIKYSTSKRIHGTVKKAETINSGLSSDTGAMVIDFSSFGK